MGNCIPIFRKKGNGYIENPILENRSKSYLEYDSKLLSYNYEIYNDTEEEKSENMFINIKERSHPIMPRTPSNSVLSKSLNKPIIMSRDSEDDYIYDMD